MRCRRGDRVIRLNLLPLDSVADSADRIDGI